jgi:hypothetical protein
MWRTASAPRQLVVHFAHQLLDRRGRRAAAGLAQRELAAASATPT